MSSNNSKEESVRQVAKYLDNNFYNDNNTMSVTEHAIEIVKIVHEVEDLDE